MGQCSRRPEWRQRSATHIAQLSHQRLEHSFSWLCPSWFGNTCHWLPRWDRCVLWPLWVPWSNPFWPLIYLLHTSDQHKHHKEIWLTQIFLMWSFSVFSTCSLPSWKKEFQKIQFVVIVLIGEGSDLWTFFKTDLRVMVRKPQNLTNKLLKIFLSILLIKVRNFYWRNCHVNVSMIPNYFYTFL